jgi:hypothetical protein
MPPVRRSRGLLFVAVAVVVVAGALAAGALLLGRGDPAREPARASKQATADEPPPVPSPSLDPLASSRPPVPPRAPSKPAAITDEQLLGEIRANVRRDPRRAEDLARQARALFPDSPNADERDALLVDALINQERIGAARSETYYYYDHHPNGRFGAHLFSMTGVHPSPPAPGRR